MTKQKLSENEIDEIIVNQADDDDAWESPISVQINVPTTLELPPKLAARAAFLARLHNTPDVESWLEQIIRERVDFEESAFAGLKRTLEERSAYRAIASPTSVREQTESS